MKRILRIGIFFIIIISLGYIWAGTGSESQIDETYSVNMLGDMTLPGEFARADGSHTWIFPADFGPHPEYQTEWWYYTGNLRSEEGRRFGYQLTFFRRGLTGVQSIEERDSIWGGNQVYMGHFALSDIDTEEHYAFERFSRGAAGLAGALAEPYHVWLENWEVVETASDEWRLMAEQEGISLELELNDEKGLILQGIDGYSQKGPEPGNASYYFSQTRLDSTGAVMIKNDVFQVKGLSWMDHEFSTSALSSGQVGWDWFSLQLSDGTDLMVFQIRREDGSIDPFSSGTMVSPNGETIRIERAQFDIQVRETWQSPHSEATYPAAWTINIPHLALIVDIEPLMNDQEMNVSYSYWEGAVDVGGMVGGQLVQGSGYVEMTGYAGSMEGEF